MVLRGATVCIISLGAELLVLLHVSVTIVTDVLLLRKKQTKKKKKT